MSVSACIDDTPEIELLPAKEWSWPSIVTLPACEPWQKEFALPELEAARGDMQIEPSAVLIPLDTLERVLVEIESVSGIEGLALEVKPVPGMEVVSVSEIQAGKAEVVLRFTEERKYLLEFFIEERGLEGSIEIQSYQTRLPIWHLRADEAEFEHMVQTPDERIKVKTTLVRDGEATEGKMRLHGASSRTLPKKSFRLNFDSPGFGDGETSAILRGEYIDKSMLRTWLGYQWFRNGTMLPTPDAEYVHLRINDRYYGLMLHVERIDKRFLSVRGLNPEGSLYEADPPSALRVPGGNLTPLSEDVDYFRTYQWHSGKIPWTDLIDFIEIILNLPDRAFAKSIASHVQIESYLVYLGMMAVLQNHEHIRRNYYIYRDPDATHSGWIFLPWDFDLAMGHLWSQADGVLGEALTVDEDIFVGEFTPERYGYFNQLTERFFQQERLREGFLESIEYILENSFTENFLESRIRYASCLIQPDLLADSKKRSSHDEYLIRVEELRLFVRGRISFAQEQLRALRR